MPAAREPAAAHGAGEKSLRRAIPTRARVSWPTATLEEMAMDTSETGNARDSADLTLITKYRRDLHRMPELSFDLPETIAYVRHVLDDLSCEVTSPCKSCVCAYFNVDAALGRPSGTTPTTAIRADMDALPIVEKSGVDFCSTKPGHMHACGHDGHMAMALAAACWVDEALAHARTQGAAVAADPGPCPLPRNVLFVFQPAEETTGGAKNVCESGVFERYHVDRIFGFHVWPDLPAGVVATRPGPLLARASETTLTIHGTSSHIAKSAEGHDALLAGAHFLTEVEDLMQLLGESEPCLLKFGHMTSGTVRNAISAESVIEGSLRVFSDEMFDRAREGVRVCAQEACERYGCTYDLHFSEGYPPVINDRKLFVAARAALASINSGADVRAEKIGGTTVAQGEAAGAVEMRGDGLALIPKPLLIAEDFAFYQRHLPGVFFLLGTGTGIPLHSDTFRMDERVLLRGLATYRALLGMR